MSKLGGSSGKSSYYLSKMKSQQKSASSGNGEEFQRLPGNQVYGNKAASLGERIAEDNRSDGEISAAIRPGGRDGLSTKLSPAVHPNTRHQDEEMGGIHEERSWIDDSSSHRRGDRRWQ